MKNARTKFSARYVTALRSHLDGANRRAPERASIVGRAALAAGLAALDVAIVHEHALVSLADAHDFADTRNGVLKRAGSFFTHVLVPLEAAQRATINSNAMLQRRHEELRLHTAALARGKLRLEREIAQRKAGEEIIRQGREQYQKLFAESQLMQEKLRQLTRQIITAQEEERKEISRELHDEVVQTLVGINVELAALGKGASQGLRSLKSKIARTQRLVENSVNAVHRFARELRPAVLDDLGLIPALHAYSKNLAARKKIRIQLTAYHGVEDLAAAVRTVMFRVAQEALTNVVRHAHATLITLSISKVSRTICMEISDNGRSFQVEKVLLARTQKRLGLIGMRERIEMIGGTLSIESAPGSGTTVRAEIPFIVEKLETKK
jgi:two-component system sensor histidine kinase DegS